MEVDLSDNQCQTQVVEMSVQSCQTIEKPVIVMSDSQCQTQVIEMSSLSCQTVEKPAIVMVDQMIQNEISADQRDTKEQEVQTNEEKKIEETQKASTNEIGIQVDTQENQKQVIPSTEPKK